MANVLVEETSLQNIANSIREKTGTTDTYKPSEMASAISSIESGGGDTSIEDGLIARTLYEISNDRVTKLPAYAFYSYSPNGNGYADFNFPNVTSIGYGAFQNANIVNINLPLVTNLYDESFNGTSITGSFNVPNITQFREKCMQYSQNLTKLEALKTKYIYTKAFQSSSIATFVFGDVVPSLRNIDAFGSTAISSGTGFIYVPDTLVDSFKSATNWSTYADQIKPISEMPTE